MMIEVLREVNRHFPQVRKTYIILRVLWYLGDKVTCPICEGDFRSFMPYEGRPNARCPRCSSLERHRLLWLYLRNKTGFFTDRLTVLDVAPLAHFSKKCKSLPNLNYIDADIDSPLVTLRLDITNMHLSDNQFDCILCLHVLEHASDDQKAMREFFRVLKPGGWAILQSPIDETRERTFEDPSVTSPEDRARVFGHITHARIYGQDYGDRIRRAGFTVTAKDYIGELPSSAIRKYGLEEGEDIYYCTKPK